MNDAFNISIFIGVFLAIIIAFFIGSMLRYHKRYVKLQKERVRNEITMLENERKRIAYDLHDSLGPVLSSVKLNINSIEAVSDPDKRIIQRAGQHIDDVIQNMRAISYNLLPIALERKGLYEALREYIEHTTSRTKFPIQLMLKTSVDIPQDKQVHVFRMLQEIIHNAIKHANAKNLYIVIGYEEGKVIIITKDDGDGFDATRIKETSKGLGLKSIESRADILNSQMLLESAPGKGTTYFFKFG